MMPPDSLSIVQHRIVEKIAIRLRNYDTNLQDKLLDAITKIIFSKFFVDGLNKAYVRGRRAFDEQHARWHATECGYSFILKLLKEHPDITL